MRDNSRSLIATALAHFINDGCLAVFPILYPLLVSFYGFTDSSVGIIATILGASSIAASPFIGRRSDIRRNYVNLILTGVLTIGFGLTAFALGMVYFGKGESQQLLLILIPLALIAGFGASFYHPLGAAILNEQWSRQTRGRAMGINGSMGSFGILAYPLIAVALVSVVSVTSVGVLGILSSVSALPIYLLMRNVRFGSGKEGLPQRKTSESAQDEMGEATENTVREDDSQGKSVAKTSARNAPIPLRLVVPPILVLTISTFLRAVFAQSILQFMPLFLTSERHVQYSFVGIAVAIMPAMGIISQPLFGYLADRFGRRLLLGISTLGAAVSIILFVATSNIIVEEAFLAMFGLFQFTGFPLILALAIEISPRGATTISNSIVWGFGNLGGAAVGPLIVGLLAENAFFGSLGSAFFIVAIIAMISVALLPFVPKPTRKD
ncbi:MAG TPA: MFS transporter [Nitrososphaerales archaeon]|nr:MFS transporter [Nitrososphaerales archaeon]